MKLLWGFSVLLLCLYRADASTAGFIKSPLSQMKLLGDWAELHCEVIGDPVPEVQWWFVEGEGEEPGDETPTQLFDGARADRVRINATYAGHAASTLALDRLALDDSGTYECRASNDPDRNELRRPPRVKWIRSQANVLVFEPAVIETEPREVSNETSAVLTCNLTSPASPVKGSYWKRNDKEIPDSRKTTSDPFTEWSLPKIDADHGGKYVCVFLTEPQAEETIEVKTAPHVKAKKPSEHGNENDKGVLVCEGHGYPLPTSWKWFKLQDDIRNDITNISASKYEIKSTPNKTVLVILDLDMELDMGDYLCEGTNELNSDTAQIHLRVRSRLAALWPFLGIVVEVIVLVTIIFIYEKRRKPDEVTDDDDSGSAPLKSNSATNHKEKNVRQRNSN